MNFNAKSVDVEEFMFGLVRVEMINNMTINLTIPFHNDLPFDPSDGMFTQTIPNEQLVQGYTKKRLQQHFPNASSTSRQGMCNDTNIVSTIKNKIVVGFYLKLW